MKRSSAVWAGCSMAFILLLNCAGADWPEWRGVNGDGYCPSGTYPVDLSPDKALWKAELPGKGCSTPIISHQRVFLTAPKDSLDTVLAFDWNGKSLWQKSFGKENPGKNENASGSNSSPATDGQKVFVYFKSGTFAALDFQGRVVWSTNLVSRFGPDTLYWDYGSSPVLSGDDVILTRMHHGESWVAAFNKETGLQHWLVSRNFETLQENDNGYSTPLVMEMQGARGLVVWGADHLSLLNAEDGKLVWECDQFKTEARQNWPTVASPVVAHNVVIVPYGRSDQGVPRLYGLRLPTALNVKATSCEQAWHRADTGTYVPTAAIANGQVFMLRDRGELECLDPESGKTLWKDAFPKTSGRYYASPLIADGKIYAVRQDGAVFVAKIKNGFQLESENHLNEPVIASPAAADSRLFIRGEKHLFCFASPPGANSGVGGGAK